MIEVAILHASADPPPHRPGPHRHVNPEMVPIKVALAALILLAAAIIVLAKAWRRRGQAPHQTKKRPNRRWRR